ncbi:hypothetical protein OCH239_10895 [Roseivivax halodurans JCM 10272]|uniref:Uncharacterized protein n=1 Tax=Roseivivax halodurans JCM 10272 TaxID=1449350 RepID=X7EBM2_9RHOB|nr:hypothetical protein [Roseivivax halodurans]ETX13342.1 hypothetical protein OCH239_10895 [Roseivivax halodurans JCM 10272]
MTQIKKTLPLSPITETTKARDLAWELRCNRAHERGLISPWRHLCGAPDPFFRGELGLEAKDDYIAFRDALKAHIRFFAADQKRLSALMRQPGGNSAAQEDRAMQARVITQLIEIRRAGKAWSKTRAKAARTAARKADAA